MQRELIERGDYVEVHNDQIMLLQLTLYNELRNEMIKQRQVFAGLLQQDVALNAALQKLEVYFAIITVYARFLNINFTAPKLLVRFNELLSSLQHPENLNADLYPQFTALFTLPTFTADFILAHSDQYQHGEFYGKMQATLARLGLLKTRATLDRLQVALA